VLGLQGIVVECTAAIFFPTVDCVLFLSYKCFLFSLSGATLIKPLAKSTIEQNIEVVGTCLIYF